MDPTAPSNDDKEGRERRLRAKLLGLPFNAMGSLILFGGVGYALDKAMKTGRSYLVGGLLLGLAWSLYETFKVVVFASRQERQGK